MTPRTTAAIGNLREGIKKMGKAMTPAAQVRRNFRLGRPPKAAEPVQMHRAVVWQKATDALSNFRERMAAAGLKREHAEAAIVYVEAANPDQPRTIRLDAKGRSSDETKTEAFEILGRDDVIALGMVFVQMDERTGQQATFPHLFVGLNKRGMDVLKSAAAAQYEATEFFKVTN